MCCYFCHNRDNDFDQEIYHKYFTSFLPEVQQLLKHTIKPICFQHLVQNPALIY